MSDLNWVNDVDTDSLSQEEQRLYKAYKAAYRAATAAREAFEAEMQLNAPDGQRLVFNYRFGKLAIALADGDAEVKAKPAKAKVSLSQFLAQQKANGGAL